MEICENFDSRVHVIGQYFPEFTNGIRCIPFNYARQCADVPSPDWWCRMDADEVYFDNPKEFLAQVSNIYSRVCTNTVTFIDFDESAIMRTDPQNYGSYIPLDWSETRFIRTSVI